MFTTSPAQPAALKTTKTLLKAAWTAHGAEFVIASASLLLTMLLTDGVVVAMTSSGTIGIA